MPISDKREYRSIPIPMMETRKDDDGKMFVEGYASTDASCRQNLRSGLTYTNNTYGGTPTCKNNNWLFKGVWYWTISPYSSSANFVFYVHSDGSLNHNIALYRESVRPSVYLKSDIKIVSGSGTKDDSFKLEI